MIPNEEISVTVAKELFEAFDTMPGAKTFSKGTLIYRQGESPDAFYFLRSGKVSIYISSQNGEEKTLATCHAGEIFGQASFFDQQPRMSSAYTLEESSIIAVRQNEVLDLFALKPKLTLSILQYLSRTIRALSAQVSRMSFLPADKRIAQYLLESDVKQINQTHEKIGQAVGASRVTVSRVLSQFSKLKWIRCSYGVTEIIDPERLLDFYNKSEN